MKQSTIAGETLEVYGDDKVLDSSKAIISDEAVQHIISILAGLYKDPITAVIREYTTNAVDAHVEAGRGNIPIQIDLPTDSRPIFKVRDFGRGLDHDGMRNVFKNVGTSTKRYTNALTGGMGIGAKCGFSLVSSMVVRSVVLINGVKTKRTYSYYKNEDLNVMLDLLREEVTSDNTGLEIEIPIEVSLVRAFEQKAIQCFRFFRTPPKIINRELPVSATDWSAGRNLLVNTRTADGIRVRAKAGSGVGAHSYGFVMGDIMYPINVNEIKKLFESKPEVMARWAKTFVFLGASWTDKRPNADIHVDVPIGTLRIAPSREELFYSSQNVMDMLVIIEKACKILDNHIQSSIEDCGIGDKAIKAFSVNRYFYENESSTLRNIAGAGRGYGSDRMNAWTLGFNSAGAAQRTEIYNRSIEDHLYEWIKSIAQKEGSGNYRYIFYYYDFEADKPIAPSVINRLIKKHLTENTLRSHNLTLLRLPEDHPLVEILDGVTADAFSGRLVNLSTVMENNEAMLAELAAEDSAEGVGDAEAMRNVLAAAAAKRKRSTIKTYHLRGSEWDPADMTTATEGYFHSILRFNLDFGATYEKPYNFTSTCSRMERIAGPSLKPMNLYGIKRAEVEKVSKKFNKLKPISAYYREFVEVLLGRIEKSEWGKAGWLHEDYVWSLLMYSKTKNTDLQDIRERLWAKDEKLDKLMPAVTNYETILSKRKDWATANRWVTDYKQGISLRSPDLIQIEYMLRGEIDDSQALRIIAILSNLEFLLDEAIKGMEATSPFANLRFTVDRYDSGATIKSKMDVLLELINSYVPDNWVD